MEKRTCPADVYGHAENCNCQPFINCVILNINGKLELADKSEYEKGNWITIASDNNDNFPSVDLNFIKHYKRMLRLEKPIKYCSVSVRGDETHILIYDSIYEFKHIVKNGDNSLQTTIEIMDSCIRIHMYSNVDGKITNTHGLPIPKDQALELANKIIQYYAD